MIVFDKLWITMKSRNISQYKLINQYGFSSGQLDRLRKNGNVSTYTLNELCKILQCGLDEIAEFRAESYIQNGTSALIENAALREEALLKDAVKLKIAGFIRPKGDASDVIITTTRAVNRRRTTRSTKVCKHKIQLAPRRTEVRRRARVLLLLARFARRCNRR